MKAFERLPLAAIWRCQRVKLPAALRHLDHCQVPCNASWYRREQPSKATSCPDLKMSILEAALRFDPRNWGLLWNTLSLQGWGYRHQWRAAPVQSWMDNIGSCMVLGSCLYKECHAAGITDRSWFSWRASVLVGHIIHVNKSQYSCFADLKAPRYVHATGNVGDTGRWLVRRLRHCCWELYLSFQELPVIKVPLSSQEKKRT